MLFLFLARVEQLVEDEWAGEAAASTAGYADAEETGTIANDVALSPNKSSDVPSSMAAKSCIVPRYAGGCLHIHVYP